MILLDTHIWVWWVSRPDRLQPRHRDLLDLASTRVFGVSIISCWEVAKLVEYGRLKLNRTVGLWREGALAEPGVSLLPLHPRIVWSPLNCLSPSIEIQQTNCWSQQPVFFSARS